MLIKIEQILQNQLNYTAQKHSGYFFFFIPCIFRACTSYMVEFVHEIIQCLVNANIKLKLQI